MICYCRHPYVPWIISSIRNLVGYLHVPDFMSNSERRTEAIIFYNSATALWDADGAELCETCRRYTRR